MLDRSKRARSSSESSQGSSVASTSSAPASPTAKMYRSNSPGATPQDASCTCHLPPTCHLRPEGTSFSSPSLLVAHQETYHSHICHATIFTLEIKTQSATRTGRGKGKQKQHNEGPEECGRTFPDERTLQCHQRECHDPDAAAKKAEGGKIYACLVPSCTLFFRTPKGRRLHLIDKHQYPPAYFFGVTLHGIETRLKGGMLKSEKREGEWKEKRDEARRKMQLGVEKSDEQKEKGKERSDDTEMDALTEGLKTTSISLVPRAVRKKQLEKEKAERMDVAAVG